MLTSAGARAVGLQGQVGALAPGELADLVIFDTEGRRSLGEILERSALPQTLAVLIGGRIASAPLAWSGPLAAARSMQRRPAQPAASSAWWAARMRSSRSRRCCSKAVYTIDDARLCRPQPTDDCVTP